MEETIAEALRMTEPLALPPEGWPQTEPYAWWRGRDESRPG
jgi:hypothetical protein